MVSLDSLPEQIWDAGESLFLALKVDCPTTLTLSFGVSSEGHIIPVPQKLPHHYCGELGFKLGTHQLETERAWRGTGEVRDCRVLQLWERRARSQMRSCQGTWRTQGNIHMSEPGHGFQSDKLKKICKMRMVGGCVCIQGSQHKHLPFSSRSLPTSGDISAGLDGSLVCILWDCSCLIPASPTGLYGLQCFLWNCIEILGWIFIYQDE